MSCRARPYELGLHERLKDPAHALAYVKAAAEDSIEGFLLALRDVAAATCGMSKVASAADCDRVNLYRMLSEEGNPRLDNLWAVLDAMGFRLSVESIASAEAPGTEPSIPRIESVGVGSLSLTPFSLPASSTLAQHPFMLSFCKSASASNNAASVLATVSMGTTDANAAIGIPPQRSQLALRTEERSYAA